jgi:hypothetical protein
MTLAFAAARVADHFDPPVNPYAEDPSAWVGERLREHFWSKQQEIAQSLVEHRMTAVHSANGVGKSFSASRFVGWWIDTYREDGFVVTSAPTNPQLSAILWREIRDMHGEHKLIGRTTLDNNWYIGRDKLVAYGRKPADAVDEEKAKAQFQGIHAKYVLIILDEAAGIPQWLWNAVPSLMTNQYARLLVIGNPDDPASEFARVCNPGSGYNVIHVSVFDTPAFTGEEVPPELLDYLPNEIWVDERKKQWGVNSPYYQSRVLGLFPSIGLDTLISPALIREAQARELPGLEAGRFGVDVADQGTDETVIYWNRGGVIRLAETLTGDPCVWQGQDTMRTVGRVKEQVVEVAKREAGAVVDGIGVGAGVVSRLREQDIPCSAFIASEKSTVMTPRGTPKFYNKRAERWWAVREMFEAGVLDIDPDDDVLASQLIAIKWDLDSSGRIKIESKDDMKKRLRGGSPDRADAFMHSTVPFEVHKPVAERGGEYDRPVPVEESSGIMEAEL